MRQLNTYAIIGYYLLRTLKVIRRLFKFSQAGQKHSDAKRAKSRGMRRAILYVAMTRDERNTADERFSTAC